MTSTKSEKTSNTVDFFPRHFGMPKNSSVDESAIAASQSIHDIENQAQESPCKMEEPSLATIKTISENIKCAVQPPETQWSHQGNQFLRAENFTPQVLRVVGYTPQVPRVENQTQKHIGWR